MLMGIKFQALPTDEQAAVLSQWMGAARFVWNAKVNEDRYLRTFAAKYLTVGTYPKLDKTYAQYKNPELSPWLDECPSIILRNSVSNWYDTYQKFLKGQCGRPRLKKKGSNDSIWLTREAFRLERLENGEVKLFIGNKTNNIGVLKINWHTKNFNMPNSIRIKKNRYGKFTVSFCYDDGEVLASEKERQVEAIQKFSALQKEELEKVVVGVDRGVNVPVATGTGLIDFTKEEKKALSTAEARKIRWQKKMARQKDKTSRRRNKTKRKIAKFSDKQANIRNNFAHNASKQLVGEPDGPTKIIVFEDLRIKNMTASAKGTVEEPGKNVAQKSGLNRSILNAGWNRICTYTMYKAARIGKYVLKINPQYTSQECADCGHIHPENRNGINFLCRDCGHSDHADQNAAKVIKKRAVNLIYSGAELSDKWVLTAKSGIGRGAKIRPKTVGGYGL